MYFCVYVFVWVLGMLFLLGIFYLGDIFYFREKMNNGLYINVIYYYVVYKNIYFKK